MAEKESSMNDNFEKKLIQAAYQGLEHRLDDIPSERSVAVVKAYALQHARRIQIRRRLRHVLSAAASAAACAVLFFAISRDSDSHDVEPVLARDYDSYLALTALTTVVPKLDDAALDESDRLFWNFEKEADFDAFAESLLRMQDSASLLTGAIAWN